MSDPFFPSPFSDARRSTRAQPSSAHAYTSFAFTDPNVLFDSLFGDINHQFMNDPFFDEPPLFANFGNPQTNFGGASPNPFAGTSFANGTSMHPIFNVGPASFEEAIAQFHGGNMGGGFPSRMFSNPGTSGFGQAWSKSTMTSSINGRTETVVTERDPNVSFVTFFAPVPVLNL